MTDYRNNPGTNIIELCTASAADELNHKQLIDRLEADIQRHGKLRVLHEVRSPRGTDPSKFWRDARFALSHDNGFSHIALVTDVDWLTTMSESTGRTLSAEVRVFRRSQIEEARQWLVDAESPVAA